MPLLYKLANRIGLLMFVCYILSDSRFLLPIFLSPHTCNAWHLTAFCFQRCTLGIHIYGYFLKTIFPFHLWNQLQSIRTRGRYHLTTREAQSHILPSNLLGSIYIMKDSKNFWHCILVQSGNGGRGRTLLNRIPFTRNNCTGYELRSSQYLDLLRILIPCISFSHISSSETQLRSMEILKSLRLCYECRSHNLLVLENQSVVG